MKVYKYLPKNRIQDLESEKFFLRFTQPSYLNDSFEFSPDNIQDKAQLLVMLREIYNQLFRSNKTSIKTRGILENKSLNSKLSEFIYAASRDNPLKFVDKLSAAVIGNHDLVFKKISEGGKYLLDLGSKKNIDKLRNNYISLIKYKAEAKKTEEIICPLNHHSEINPSIVKAFAQALISQFHCVNAFSKNYIKWYIKKNSDVFTREGLLPIQLVIKDALHETAQQIIATEISEASSINTDFYDFSKSSIHHKYGILSLGTSDTTEDLWDYYSSSEHKKRDGYCLEFELDKMFDFEFSSGFVHYYENQIEMLNQRPSIEIEKRNILNLDKFISATRFFQKQSFGIDADTGVERCWKNENEFRLVSNIDDNKNFLDPLNNKFKLLPYNPMSLTKIIVGEGASIELKDSLLKFANSWKIPVVIQKAHVKALPDLEPSI